MCPIVRRVLAALCAAAGLLSAREAAAQRDLRCEHAATAATDTVEVTPSGDTTFTLAQVDSNPEITNQRAVLQMLLQNQPLRPSDQRVSGCAVVRIRVDANGRVDRRRPQVVYATDPAFGETAATIARRMVFRPAQRAGRPVAVWYNVPVSLAIFDDKP